MPHGFLSAHLKCFWVLLCLVVCPASPVWATGAVQRLEVVTSAAVTGDGGNAWGGHHTRIVSNQYGIFSLYTVAGTGAYTHTSAFDKEWRLAKRTADNEWTVIAQGPSGREPACLLTAPDDTLRVFAWPNMVAEMWTINQAGVITAHITVPGSWKPSDWPYHTAGINPSGDMVVWQSDTTNYYSYYNATTGQWTSCQSSAASMKRHCYCYVFPGSNGEVTSVGTRDVLWTDLGQSYSGYAFTATGYFHTPNAAAQPTLDYLKLREASSGAWTDWCCASGCVYVDTERRVHVIYFYVDDGSRYQGYPRHMVIRDGAVVADVAIPSDTTWPHTDIIQSSSGQFFVITPTAIYPAKSEDGTVLGDPIAIDLGQTVEYGGISLASPQAGVPLANDYVDMVFPSGGGAQMIYARLALQTTRPSGTVSVNAGAAYTSTPGVSLALSATDATITVTDMRFSNDGVTWSTWEAYATTKAWATAAGDGVKNVRVQFRNAAGYESGTIADTISLDTTPPTGSLSINSGAVLTNTTTASLAISASDSLSGVSQMRFRQAGGDWSDWQAYSASKSWILPSGDGVKTVETQLKDAIGNISAVFSDSITLDATPPSAPGTPTDAGAYTGSTSLVFNWSAASDATAGVARYVCQIGTSPGASNTFSGYLNNVLTKTATGSYGGNYFCRVHAVDAAGNHGDWSASSDGIAVVTNPGISIATAKGLTTSASLGMPSKVVSAVFADRFYVQEADRSAGILIRPVAGMPSGIAVGDIVGVGGVLKLDPNDERRIDGVVALTGATASVLPVSMTNASVGGGPWLYSASPAKGQSGITGAAGLSNIGLLVKAWGRVSAIDATSFAISDGSGVDVVVSVPSGLSVPPGGCYVAVTGISSCRKVGNDLARRVLVRDAADVTVLQLGN